MPRTVIVLTRQCKPTTGPPVADLVHLLGELEKVDRHNNSAWWEVFAKKLRRGGGKGVLILQR